MKKIEEIVETKRIHEPIIKPAKGVGKPAQRKDGEGWLKILLRIFQKE